MEYYIFNIENLTDEEYNTWFSFMSKEKQERVKRYRNIERRKCAVAGEMLVKSYIGKALDTPPLNIEISEHSNGKPYVKNSPVHFNISHSENMLICAFSDNEIGVDIEKIRPISLSVLKRFFSEKEQEYVLGHTPDEKDFTMCNDKEILGRFCQLFTLKEAICKKSGIGVMGIKDADTLPYLNCSFKENDFYISIIE